MNAEIGPMADFRKENGRDKPWNIKYWGIGNESWGCGGNMNPEYYSSLFKQYSTFCNANYKILSGGTPDDFNWTETIMKETQRKKELIQGYSYHYYTICHDWNVKGSATDFNEDEWFNTMKNTLLMEENLKAHIAIMDKYDPEKKVALVADEWGNWFDPEPGTNDAFLYQQNTLRDALTAGIDLNIFNNLAERIKMANIAQTVNVLQSVILTKDEKIVKTPTFYVFKMYKVHQDATLLTYTCKSVEYVNGEEKIPALNVSVSKNSAGIIHVSVVNIDPENPHDLNISINGSKINKVTAQIITADKMNALNDYGKEEVVNIQSFKDFSKSKEGIKAILPSKSVVMFEITE